MPALREVFPQYLDTFTRSASHAAQAQVLLDEVAQEDWLRVCNPSQNAPEIKKLQSLSNARQSNVLRFWLKSRCQSSASAAQLQELLSQIAACTTAGHQIQIKVGSGFVRRSKAELAWYNETV
jgi:tRNA(Ile)-lysidine synthase